MKLELFRRYLLLVALMFWQGGFMFYGGVVVPVGSHVLGSDTQQGFITQSVTNYLNLAGALAISIWGTTLWFERRGGVTKLEVGLWVAILLALALLVSVHFLMDRLLDPATTSIIDPKQFRLFHKIYIGTSSLQWIFCLLLLFLNLKRWNRRDSSSG